MKKRILALLVAFILIFTIAIGCGNGNETTTTAPADNGVATTAPDDETTTAPDDETTTDTTKAEWESFEKYDPPITLTMNFMHVLEDNRFPGDDEKNNAFTRWALDNFGIIWEPKWLAATGEDDEQKLNLAAASGDMPDVIRNLNLSTTLRLANAGVLAPIDNLLDQYGSPLLNHLVNDYNSYLGDDIYSALMVNGHLMAIPQVADVWASIAQTQWIRSDILNDLDISVPSTLDEFEQAIIAYKAINPDGIGYLIDKDLSTLGKITSAFGAYPGVWVEANESTLAYGSIQPGIKDGLTVLNRWYENEFIDQEFIVKDGGKTWEDFVAGKALSMSGAWWNVHYPFPAVLENNPEARIEPVPILRGPEGQSALVVNSPLNWINAISVSCSHPEAVIWQLNVMSESTQRNELDLRSLYDFRYPETEVRTPVNKEEIESEGQHVARYDYPQDIVGPQFFNEYLPHGAHYYGLDISGRPEALLKIYLNMYDAVSNNLSDQLQGIELEYFNQFMEYGEPVMTAHFDNVLLWQDQWESGLITMNKYLGPPTATMIERDAYLKKIELETFAKIIMGELDIDAFDTFVQDWLSSGGELITQEVNNWYSGVQ